MKHIVALFAFIASSCAAASTQQLPIHSGQYTFLHKFAEQPNMAGTPVVVRIKGRHIVVINTMKADGFPIGVIAEGTLMWHAKHKEWIIGDNDSDRYAEEVGGCSGGPEEVDLRHKIFWTC
jgi:hypothetical protein